MHHAWYLIRWGWYATGLLLWAAYSLLNFVSKPATRRIVPFLILGAIILLWSDIRLLVGEATKESSSLATGIVWTVLMLFIGAVCVGYLWLSRLMSMALSVFPPVRRPLRPMATVVAAPTLDQPVIARIVVPPLP